MCADYGILLAVCVYKVFQISVDSW